jgi:hypothetical protein
MRVAGCHLKHISQAPEKQTTFIQYSDNHSLPRRPELLQLTLLILQAWPVQDVVKVYISVGRFSMDDPVLMFSFWVKTELKTGFKVLTHVRTNYENQNWKKTFMKGENSMSFHMKTQIQFSGF